MSDAIERVFSVSQNRFFFWSNATMPKEARGLIDSNECFNFNVQ